MPLLSMTGFGELRDERDNYAFVVEVRTINSRHFKLNLRVTDGYGALEAHAETVIREYVKRGTIHCNLRIRHIGGADDLGCASQGTLGRAGSTIHSLQEPGYKTASGRPAMRIASMLCAAVTPEPQ